MTVSSYRHDRPWIPVPWGLSPITSALHELRSPDRAGFAVAALFSVIGLVATMIAITTGGSAFDFGGMLAAAG